MVDGESGNASVFCTNCGQKLTDTDQFCPECGAVRPAGATGSAADIGATPPAPAQSPVAAVPPSYSPPPSSFAPVMPFGTMAPALVEPSKPLLNFDVAYPDRLSRLLIFVKWLLAIPHYIVLSLYSFVISITTFLAFFAILFTGKYPRGLWDLAVGYYRWQANVNAYTMLQRDEYPPFSGTEPYPVRFELAYPERLSRLLIFVKWLLIIPAALVYIFVIFAAMVVVLIAFFAILLTGRFPRGMFDFVTGTMRWGNRINLYTNLLTDAYPPFTTEP